MEKKNKDAWEDVSTPWQKSEGEERHVKYFGEGVKVSVLHRFTGFGYWEWESALVFFPAHRKYNSDESRIYIVRGDRRKELDNLRGCELMPWYREHEHEKNSMETLLDAMKS